MKKGDIIYAVLVIVIGLVCGFVGYHTWTLGNNGEDYETVCIGDHEYYRANFATKIAVAIRLDDNGKPVRCKQ